MLSSHSVHFHSFFSPRYRYIDKKPVNSGLKFQISVYANGINVSGDKLCIT